MTHSRFKFRVWDKQEKEYLRGLYDGPEVLNCFWDDSKKGIRLTTIDKDRYVLEESTGLYDCEGREIWEGDIIEYQHYGKYLIYFDDGAFRTECIEKIAFESFMINTDLLINSVNCDGRNPHAKVIGNRFENSELLEGKE